MQNKQNAINRVTEKQNKIEKNVKNIQTTLPSIGLAKGVKYNCKAVLSSMKIQKQKFSSDLRSCRV